MIRIVKSGNNYSDNVLDSFLDFNSIASWSVTEGTGSGEHSGDTTFEGGRSLKITNTDIANNLTITNTTQNTLIDINGDYGFAIYVRKEDALKTIKLKVNIFKNAVLLDSPTLTIGDALDSSLDDTDVWVRYMSDTNYSFISTDEVTFTFQYVKHATDIGSRTIYVDGMMMYQKERLDTLPPRYHSSNHKTIEVSHPILIPFDFPINNKTDLNSIHGSLLINNSEDGIILNSTTPIVGDGGVSKVMAVVLAGTVTTGSYTITGTSIDRNTGVETASDTEIINIDGLSINNSTVDSNGNTVYDYTDAYVSFKWWKGTLTFSTTDLDLTEIRFAQISFEQFNDTPDIVIDTFDTTYITSNVSAEMDAYLYSVEVNGNMLNVSVIADLHHETGLFADNSYRRRNGNIAKSLDGTTDGIFIDLYLNPENLTYFSSFTAKVWATHTLTINLP